MLLLHDCFTANIFLVAFAVNNFHPNNLKGNSCYHEHNLRQHFSKALWQSTIIVLIVQTNFNFNAMNTLHISLHEMPVSGKNFTSNTLDYQPTIK